MFCIRRPHTDIERGPDSGSESGRAAVPMPQITSQARREEQSDSGEGMRDQSGDGAQRRSPAIERKDFDESANPLWSLYGREAKSRDEARIQALKDDMDGVLIFAGLFSAVLTSFVVPKIQDLQVDPALQSVYYQNQSVQVLAQISQQIASIGTVIPLNATPLLPYPSFHPSPSASRVNVYWLVSLIFSLSAALLATVVQQSARAYLRDFQSPSSALKTVRIRMFLFEGVERLQTVAEVVPAFIHFSLALFFLGLADTVLNIDTRLSVATIVPIVICGFFYLYSVIAPIMDPQSPYRNPFSKFIWHLFQTLLRGPHSRSPGTIVRPLNMEARQEQLAMAPTDERKARDVRAVQWLVDNIHGSNETGTLIQAIPGSFNQEWGREVWKSVSSQAIHPPEVGPVHSIPSESQPQPPPALPCLREGTPVYNLCKSMRFLFETYNIERDFNSEAGRRRMHGCIETAASLVCCADVQLKWFGEVGEVLSELGYNEQTNEPLIIRSAPSFAIRWTCLSLVAIWQMVDRKELRVLAGFALTGIVRFQLDYGGQDAEALEGARTIDEYLKAAWGYVEDLYQAFEPWSPQMTAEETRGILASHEEYISGLEVIKTSADVMNDVDLRTSLLQDAVGEVTHNLRRKLPGLSFSELQSTGPVTISEAFDFPIIGDTPITPQLIFPGQQLQSLCTLGQRLRDIIDGRNLENLQETLESLRSIDKISVLIRRPNDLMKRQLLRLQDLRDGGGLGFTIEHFFIALRQLESCTSSLPELKRGLYCGAFNVITSRSMPNQYSSGTQGILLELICDLVIKSRGVFSDFVYPSYIVDMLLELVGKMIDGHGGTNSHVNDAVAEIQWVNSRNFMDKGLKDRVLRIINPF